MGHTLAEKIIMKHIGGKSVKPGDLVVVEPDCVVIHDIYTAFLQDKMKKMGLTKVWNTDKIVIMHDVESLLDHIIIMNQSQLLLDASISNICEKYTFEYRNPQEMDDTVLYAEPTLQGNAAICKRQEGKQETQMNLELLFNAVINGKLND
jgi:homoaconitase/3-isopropylmalate dehydratase large subunit